jgi:hypothetical protein
MKGKPPRRATRDRWLSLTELAELLKDQHPKLASLNRHNLRRYVRRLVQRLERRDGEDYTRRVGGRREVQVSLLALETLRPYDAKAFTELGIDVAQLVQQARGFSRRLNGHGSRLREAEKRLSAVEKKQRLTAQYLAEIAEVDAATRG